VAEAAMKLSPVTMPLQKHSLDCAAICPAGVIPQCRLGCVVCEVAAVAQYLVKFQSATDIVLLPPRQYLVNVVFGWLSVSMLSIVLGGVKMMAPMMAKTLRQMKGMRR